MILRSLAQRLGTLGAIGALTIAGLAAPASAATSAASHDDSYILSTGYANSKCPDGGPGGDMTFHDYGPGAAGGGNNDDYLTITDGCGDGDGVVGYAWQNSGYLGWKYNGGGLGSTVVWDPFLNGDVKRSETIIMKVCSINGVNGTPYDCKTHTLTSVDG